jgi:hypothetical protein
VRLIAATLLAGAAPAAAGTIVTSPAPDSVAITIYPAPHRRPGTPMNLDWLEGYALITEKRTVQLPAGDATVRFEGVAGGMLAESALVDGLPAGVREKNLDADLLAPSSLYARGFGRPVTLRRMHLKTGKIVEQRAIIRSGPDGAILLQTREGFEAARCGPLNDALVYAGVPPGLPARPTLSVETSAPRPARVTLSLSYLAWGFDWQADYVLRMRERDTRGELSAWVTLASSDPTSFVDADVSVVAGKVNRENGESDGSAGRGEALVFHCFFSPQPAAPLSAGYNDAFDAMGDIVVTAMRRNEQWLGVPVTVSAEGLGDLKLYRVPMPTTLASNSQKQIALFDKRSIRLDMIYYTTLSYGERAYGPYRMLRTRNEAKQGLGLSLPTGPLALFEPLNGEPMYVQQSGVRGNAVGEMLELPLGAGHQVSLESRVDGIRTDDDGYAQSEFGKGKRRTVNLTVRNANPWPIDLEAGIALPQDDEETQYRLEDPSAKLISKYGRPQWDVRVPANGTANLRYKLRKIEIE